MPHPIIQTIGLTKGYAALTALEDCGLTVGQGEVFGLLGPNGAGKSTLIRLLLGFLRPSAGTAKMKDLDCCHQSRQVREETAYLPGEVRLIRNMRGIDLLKFLCNIHPRGDWERSLAAAERLEVDLSRKTSACSSGMRQKLALAATFGLKTSLIILDEPTTHLDPTARRRVLELSREAQQEGRTMLFSSHVISEVEAVCDRVAVLRRGRLVHTECLQSLRRRHRVSAQLSGPFQGPPEGLTRQLTNLHQEGTELTVEVPGELSAVLGWLATLPLAEIKIEPLGLQGVYDRFHAETEDK